MQNSIKKSLTVLAILISCLSLKVHADDTGMNVGREVMAAEALANVPGHKLTAIRVEIPPDSVSPSHRHDAFVFVYVLEGTVQSQLNNGEIIEYKSGQSWVEPLGALHSHASNPSKTETATVLAVYVAKEDAKLTTIEKTSQ